MFICLLFMRPAPVNAQGAGLLLRQGWQLLVRDNDTAAIRCFGNAMLLAQQQNDTANAAQAYLDMGICYYSISNTEGLRYCYRAMDEYRKMDVVRPAQALEGRCRCLQLLSTINSRQGKYREAVALSREALKGFDAAQDTAGYIGLIYNSLGSAYQRLGAEDSSQYYHRMALTAHLRGYNTTYLPTAYLKVAAIERKQGSRDKSRYLYDCAMHLADSTGNRQAQVQALLGLGDWEWAFTKDAPKALALYRQAGAIAVALTDKAFSQQVAASFLSFYIAIGDFKQALPYKDTINAIRDSMYSWDRRKEVKALELQYDVAEKERQLQLVQKDREVVVLTNYLLWGGLAVVVVLAVGAIVALRRINRRDRLLLQTKEELVLATRREKELLDAQRQLREQQLQQELGYKESQLSAMTLQMLQKNEWAQELKERLEESKTLEKDQKLNRLISRGMTQDKEWDDFNTYFESINQHFYRRLKVAYPGISPNDLKLCALIRQQLSIKEMAAILNISPDSVKTARYRLRKKLGLNTEDNLTAFIIGL